MIRPIVAIWAALALTSANVAGSTVASAEPPPPCSFTLSPPHLVQMSGVPMVTATVTPAECGPPAAPYVSVACVQVQGDDSAKQCGQGRGADSAQVYYAPYRPGVTYTATGRGCGSWIGTEPAPLCQMLGPVTAAL